MNEIGNKNVYVFLRFVCPKDLRVKFCSKFVEGTDNKLWLMAEKTCVFREEWGSS